MGVESAGCGEGMEWCGWIEGQGRAWLKDLHFLLSTGRPGHCKGRSDLCFWNVPLASEGGEACREVGAGRV